MSSYRKINPNLHGGAQNLTERVKSWDPASKPEAFLLVKHKIRRDKKKRCQASTPGGWQIVANDILKYVTLHDTL